MKFDIKEGGKITVAIYQDSTSSYYYCTVFDAIDAEGKVQDHQLGHYIRVSNAVEIDFRPRNAEEVQLAAIAAVDKQMEDLRADTGRRMAALEDRRAQLLSLTHQAEDALA